MNRRWRFITAMLSLCALLFTQGALAGYACEGVAKASWVAEMAEMADAGMPCADGMAATSEAGTPALCHAHCQSTATTADNLQPPALADAAQLGAVLTVQAVSPPAFTGRAVQASLLRPSASPPLAISHCCFRI